MKISVPEPSEFVKATRDPEKRLQWIREHLGEETYLEAMRQRERNAQARRKARELEESMKEAGWFP